MLGISSGWSHILRSSLPYSVSIFVVLQLRHVAPKWWLLTSLNGDFQSFTGHLRKVPSNSTISHRVLKKMRPPSFILDLSNLDSEMGETFPELRSTASSHGRNGSISELWLHEGLSTCWRWKMQKSSYICYIILCGNWILETWVYRLSRYSLNIFRFKGLKVCTVK